MISFKQNPVIILVEPQLGENIGSAARAMKNFGLTDLRIINPRDGWPNQKAEELAAHAIDIINKATIYENLNDAIWDLEYVYATTVRKRNLNKDYINSNEISHKYDFNLKTGILFGRENSGLSNDEICYANKIITISTDNNNSLNLAQSIVIISYELYPKTNTNYIPSSRLATKIEMKHFLNHLFTELEKRNFFKNNKTQIINNISNIFSRLDKLTSNEVQTLRGVIKSLSQKED